MDLLTTDWTIKLLSVAAGLGLSAACGFRVFLPFAAISLAAMIGYLPLTPEFAWLGQWPALIILSTATIVEIGAYYIPWVDNLLDTIATPVAVLAGAIAAAAVLVDMPPEIRWTVVAIAGGTAGVVQTGSVLTRALSTAITGGLGNVAVASSELIGAALLALLAILLPPLALLLVIVLMVVIIRRLWRRRQRAIEPGIHQQAP
ncbi:MAG: DUF4126 domain-containing protein [Caldilineaceae bacterium]